MSRVPVFILSSTITSKGQWLTVFGQGHGSLFPANSSFKHKHPDRVTMGPLSSLRSHFPLRASLCACLYSILWSVSFLSSHLLDKQSWTKSISEMWSSSTQATECMAKGSSEQSSSPLRRANACDSTMSSFQKGFPAQNITVHFLADL